MFEIYFGVLKIVNTHLITFSEGLKDIMIANKSIVIDGFELKQHKSYLKIIVRERNKVTLTNI
jgi:hypothetical protein